MMKLPPIEVTDEGPMVVGAGPDLLRSLLGVFEQEAEARVGPLDGWVLPGLSASEIIDAMAAEGLRAPEELIVLFNWNNGVPFGRYTPFPRLPSVSLADALSTYRSRQEVFTDQAEELGVDVRELFWGAGEGWLPLYPDLYTLAVDCTGPSASAPRVRAKDPGFDETEDPRRGGQVVSLCTVVTWWIEGIRCGGHYWVPDKHRWHTDDSKLPLLQREIGVW